MRRQDGYTLMELMLVVTIWAFCIAVASLATSRLIALGRVETAANRLADDLTLARSLAIARSELLEIRIPAGSRVASSYWFEECTPDATKALEQCNTKNDPDSRLAEWAQRPASEGGKAPEGIGISVQYTTDERHLLFDRTGRLQIYSAEWALQPSASVNLEVCSVVRQADNTLACKTDTTKTVTIHPSGMISL